MKRRRFTVAVMAVLAMAAAPLAMAGAVVVPAAVATVSTRAKQHTPQRLSTGQMYRNYMRTGSIYYSDSTRSGPPAKRVTVTDQPLLQSIETEATKMAQPPKFQKTSTAQVSSNN